MAGGEEERVAGQLEKCLRSFAQDLPARVRDVLIAADFDGRPQRELAEQLGVPYSTVKDRVQQGRRLLRQRFASCCGLRLEQASDCDCS